jgi:hypothetical protein
VWTHSAATAAWIESELRGAHFEPLFARSFRHVDTSLRPGSRPEIRLAVIDFTAIEDTEVEALIAARWAGYAGAVVAIAPLGHVSQRTRTLIDVRAVIPLAGPLRETCARLITCLGSPSAR